MFCLCVSTVFLLNVISVKFIRFQGVAVVLSFSSLYSIIDQEHTVILLSILLLMALWILSWWNCFHSCCYRHSCIPAHMSIKYIPKSRTH